MQRESYRDPSIQTANDYEIRISYLEEIVRFLLARKEPGPLPSVSSASLGGSFRYSIDRGLVPLLSKTTAQSLIITRSSHRNLKKPFNITQTASSTKPNCPLLSTSEPHHKPSRSSSRASPTAYRKRHSIATSDSQISIGGDKTQSLISTRPFPLVSKRDRTDISALVMPSELHALHTINPAQQSNNAIITKSLDPSPTPCLLNAACATTTTSTQTTSSHCCSSSNSLTTPLLSTLPVSTPLPEPALLECSEVFIPAQTSTCTPQHINLPPSPVHATRPLSALTTCSLAIDLTAQVCPDKCDATDVGIITINEYSDISTDFLGSITIVEHNSTSLAPNLAPDLSQLALDHYDEIDNYLKLANADETETKKKKKKKIKKRPIPLQLLTYQFPTLLQLLTIHDLSSYATDARTDSDLSSYATDASNATLVLEFARAHQLSSAHTSLSIYVSVRVIPDPYSCHEDGSHDPPHSVVFVESLSTCHNLGPLLTCPNPGTSLTWRNLRPLSTSHQSSGNTRPRPGILDQPADLDLIFSTLIINDSPIHQQRSGRPSKSISILFPKSIIQLNSYQGFNQH
ncbi:hypothetical protein Pst134EB_020100 [Puccinia striiformis f. sp. tritici]|nr:hypothetical protein Pst134EB_020100 [Puccinia striiformis f. sp. tritici]